MVQFQNLDPFQHRVWRYLNVDETGIDRPGVERRGGRGDPRARRRDRPALRAGRPARRRGHGRQRSRLRPLPGPDPRQPDPGRRRRRPAAGLGRAGSAGGRCRRATASGSGARSATTRRAVGVVRPVGRRPVPVRLEADPGLRPAPGHRGDGLRELAPRARRRDDRRTAHDPAADRRRPRRPPPQALAEARHPETGTPLFPQIIATAETYQLDPAREGYPDLIALPDEPYWVRTKLTSGHGLGRARPQPPRHAPARGDRRPGRRGPAARPEPPGQPDRRHAHDPRPSGPADPGPHRRQADRRRRGADRDVRTSSRPATTRQEHLDGPHRSPFEYSPEEQAIIEQRLADLGYLE